MPLSTIVPLQSAFLDKTTKAWLGISFIGQAIFALYIILLYGKNGLAGNWEQFNNATPQGHTPGDLTGNIIFGIHVAMAAIVTIGGPLQLIPYIRKNAPKLHRINGRIYVLCGFMISVAGLYLTWVRGSVGGMTGNIFITLNATVILVSIYFTIRYALARKIQLHNQWALRLFLGMSGVWFFRVYLMFWIGINQGPVGFDPDAFQGPALTTLYVITYILPLMILEGYFYAQRSKNAFSKYIAVTFFIILSLCTIVGISIATMGMWLPNM